MAPISKSGLAKFLRFPNGKGGEGGTGHRENEFSCFEEETSFLGGLGSGSSGA